MFIFTEELDLSPTLEEVMAIFNANQDKYLSTIYLREAGICSPGDCIARLKEKGVVFEKITQTVTDRTGKVYRRVACYRIVGFL